MKLLVFAIILCIWTSSVKSSPWDFTIPAISKAPLKKSLLVTSCPSSDGRPLIMKAFSVTNPSYVIEEPSNSNSKRIQCRSDSTMQQALSLTINRDLDDDSITNKADRQRMEIKTPLQQFGGPVAVAGSTFTYAWWFQINSNVKPPGEISQFFHIFQIKSNLENTEPLVTLSLHNSGNLRLRVVRSEGDTATQYNLAPISQVAGVWNQVMVTVYYNKNNGYVQVALKNSNGLNIQQTVSASTFWSSTDFYRAKWGLYRSRSPAYNKEDTLLLQNIQIRGTP